MLVCSRLLSFANVALVLVPVPVPIVFVSRFELNWKLSLSGTVCNRTWPIERSEPGTECERLLYFSSPRLQSGLRLKLEVVELSCAEFCLAKTELN